MLRFCLAALWIGAVAVPTRAQSPSAESSDAAPPVPTEEASEDAGPEGRADGDAGRDGERAEAAVAAFAEGQRAASELRWRDAADAFERAAELATTPSARAYALYSLGLALRALDAHVAARDTFDRVLALYEAEATLSETDAERAEQTRALRAQSQERVATLALVGLAPEPHDVRVDGLPWRDEGERPLRGEVDPGEHTLLVERPGFEPFVWTGRAEPGGSVEVAVSLEPRLQPEDPRLRRRRRALWISLSLVLVGAAVGAGLGIRAARQVDPPNLDFPSFQVP